MGWLVPLGSRYCRSTRPLLRVNAASVVRLTARPIREEIVLNLFRYATKNCFFIKQASPPVLVAAVRDNSFSVKICLSDSTREPRSDHLIDASNSNKDSIYVSLPSPNTTSSPALPPPAPQKTCKLHVQVPSWPGRVSFVKSCRCPIALACTPHLNPQAASDPLLLPLQKLQSQVPHSISSYCCSAIANSFTLTTFYHPHSTALD